MKGIREIFFEPGNTQGAAIELQQRDFLSCIGQEKIDILFLIGIAAVTAEIIKTEGFFEKRNARLAGRKQVPILVHVFPVQQGMPHAFSQIRFHCSSGRRIRFPDKPTPDERAHNSSETYRFAGICSKCKCCRCETENG